MSVGSELVAGTFFTVPSRFQHLELPPFPRPYRRVVGFSWDEGYAHANHQPQSGTYRAHEFKITRLMAEGIGAFITAHLSKYDPLCAAHEEAAAQEYMCHDFAMMFTRAENLIPSKGLHAAYRAIMNRPRKPFRRIGVGEVGIMYDNAAHMREPYHSFVGLGTDVDATIQVVDYASNLALMSYDELREDFKEHSEHTKIGLAVLPAAMPPAA